MRVSTVALVGCLVAGSVGCATAAAMRAGQRAESQQDYDRAVIEYTKVVRERPNDRSARASLEQAKMRAAQDHFARGRRLASIGKLEEALVELQIAGELNPTNGSVQEELSRTRSLLRTKIAVSEEGKTRLETVIARSLEAPLPGVDLPPDVTMPDTLLFRDASSREVFTAIAKFANLSITFDPTFRDQPITVDLRNKSLAEALNAVTLTTRNFWRVTAQRTVTIVPDTPAKRREYEEEVIRTFYLSNADLKETIDILRIVVDNRRLAPMTATNAIAVKDTPDRIAAAGKLINALDKARPEVVIDVELLEVDRTRLKEYGLQIASPAAPGISGQATVDAGLTLRDLRNLTQSDVFLSGLPGLYYRLLKTDAATRVLANPQLRTSEGIAAQGASASVFRCP
jgi:general secretion pathway protein D